MSAQNLSSLATQAAPIKSELTFLKRDLLWNHEKPYRIRYVPIGDIPKTNFLLETCPVHIYDIRPVIPSLSLETNGFEVHDLMSALDYTDFFDYDKVHAVYMKEVQGLVKNICGAKHAHPLDYEV